MAGSRSGGIIAATWASMMNHGQEGYIKGKQISKGILYVILKLVLSQSTGCLILLHPPNFLLEIKVIIENESNPCYPRIYKIFEQE